MNENGQGPGLKIVVADGDDALVQTLAWVLQDKGYTSVVVKDPALLLEVVEKEAPDLVLLDLMLQKDGVGLLGALKGDVKLKEIPVIVLSSSANEEETVQAFSLGASDFVAKPFKVRELLVRVEARVKEAQHVRRVRDEARSRAEMVDILHEVTDSLKPDEIFHILTRRVARALNVAKCSMVSAKPGSDVGLVVAAAENPMLRNLEIPLPKYPEVKKALETRSAVFVKDVETDPLYAEARKEWKERGIAVPTRSTIVLPFLLQGEMNGVFFVRTTRDDETLTEEDAHFAEAVISTAVNAIERAYDLEAAKSDRERFQFLANTDPLTHCVNRRAMLDRLKREMDRARRYDHELGLMMIDIDWFKRVNDTYGHLAGDAVLQQFGGMLRQEARSVDVVARYGGEEFALVLPDTSMKGAMIFAERVRKKLEAHEFVEGEHKIRVTVSIGVSTFSNAADGGTAEVLIDRADAALYKAKRNGRNQVCA
ncbi:MAG: diguanylate cyclase [Gemmatimonadota bacterium]|nr:diguanylate cyclase [Gemmatimonadota bacterium]MDH5804170.1 diguanylate cyclase [Gemmatimonadota bacterium]